MLHPLTFALAIFLAQDGAPAPAPAVPPAPPKVAPPAPPAPPVQTAPAPLPTTTVPKTNRPVPAAAASVVKKDGKAAVIPTPRVREPEIPSFRVSVTMPGNRRFVGVVMRDKLFNELVRQNAHNTQDVYHRTENFTLRFVDGVDGDVTLRWNQVVKVDVRAILDSAGLRTIEENYHRLMILKKEQEEADRAKQDAEEEKGRQQGDGEKPTDGEKGEKGEKSKAKDEELPPLLAEFRPDEGWSPKRKEDIEWRRSIVGTAPDKAEQRFLEVYPQWFEAFNLWKADQAAKQAEGDKGEAKKDDANKDDSRKDGSKDEKPKSDDAKKDDSKGDDSKKGEKKDESKKDEDGKDDDSKKDEKKDDSGKEPAKPDEPKDGGGQAH